MYTQGVLPDPAAIRALLLELLYPLPDPLTSDREYQQWTHADLAGLTLGELLAERDRLKLRLLYDRRPKPWLLERLDVLQERLNDAR